MRIEINNGHIIVDHGWKAASYPIPKREFKCDEGVESYDGNGIRSYFKSDRGPIDAERKDFVWETHKGKRIKPEDMATPHLFNTIKMLWNNTVPPVFRVGPFKRYRDVGTWDLKYLTRALDELQDEFESRDDIESEDRDLFNDMLLNSDVSKQL